MNHTTTATSTYYEVLGVDRNADDKAIRQAYLRQSLQHHPDKNPDCPEEAKARFVQIGQAYDVLKDPVQRRQYDRQLLSGGGGPASAAPYSYSDDYTTTTTTTTTEEQYDTYAEAFDAHVAGMSEEELRAAMGAAAVVGSLIGSLVVGKMNKSRGGLLGTAGSLVGSAVASEAASSMVRSLHESSVERVAYRRERQAAMERGEEMPPLRRSSNSNNWQKVVGKTVNALKETLASSSSSPSARSSQQPQSNGTARSSASNNNNNNDGWKQTVGSVLNAASKVMDQHQAATRQRQQS